MRVIAKDKKELGKETITKFVHKATFCCMYLDVRVLSLSFCTHGARFPPSYVRTSQELAKNLDGLRLT